MKDLVLASASPARAALLRDAGVEFEVSPTAARELKGRGRTLRQAVLENARRKAAAAARRHPGRWVLAADTMIEFQGRLYGKPGDRRGALRLLGRLAGHTHRLATGVVLRQGGRSIERIAFTDVTFRPLVGADIRRLLNGYDATRLAGGYAIRRGRDPLVARIRGSFSNVVGLPMEVLPGMLRAAGVK